MGVQLARVGLRIFVGIIRERRILVYARKKVDSVRAWYYYIFVRN